MPVVLEIGHDILDMLTSNLLNLHTLTHAAEDVGFDEVYKFAYKVNENGEFQQPGTSSQNNEMYVLDSSMLAIDCIVLRMASESCLFWYFFKVL
jgi:hypothetical protein